MTEHSEHTDFNDAIRKRYEGHQVPPPKDLWSKVSAKDVKNETADFDERIGQRYVQHGVSPPPHLWDTIQTSECIEDDNDSKKRVFIYWWLLGLFCLLAILAIIFVPGSEQNGIAGNRSAVNQVESDKSIQTLKGAKWALKEGSPNENKRVSDKTNPTKIMSSELAGNQNETNVVAKQLTGDSDLGSLMAKSTARIDRDELSIGLKTGSSNDSHKLDLSSNIPGIQRTDTTGKLEQLMLSADESNEKDLNDNPPMEDHVNKVLELKENFVLNVVPDSLASQQSLTNDLIEFKDLPLDSALHPDSAMISELVGDTVQISSSAETVDSVLSDSLFSQPEDTLNKRKWYVGFEVLPTYSHFTLDKNATPDIANFYRNNQKGNIQINCIVNAGYYFTNNFSMTFGIGLKEYVGRIDLDNTSFQELPIGEPNFDDNSVEIMSIYGSHTSDDLVQIGVLPDWLGVEYFYGQAKYVETVNNTSLYFPLTIYYRFLEKKFHPLITIGLEGIINVKGSSQINIVNKDFQQYEVNIQDFAKNKKFNMGSYAGIGVHYDWNDMLTFSGLVDFRRTLFSSHESVYSIKSYAAQIGLGVQYRF